MVLSVFLCTFVPINMTQIEDYFFALVRAALKGGIQEETLATMMPTDEEWQRLYTMAWQQSLIGMLFTVVGKLQMPPSVAKRWIGNAEKIRGQNQLQNSEAARLTQLFAEKGHRTAILKGQANALFYPDPLTRQIGDIDIWVEGGKDEVLQMLLSSPEFGKTDIGQKKTWNHHFRLPPNEKGVVIEVHFRPSSGNFYPITNHRMQRWLEDEIKNTTMVEEGFNVPSAQFALVMQLAHILHHILDSGIGLRQICDYYCLLKASTEEDRTTVASLLKRFGLYQAAGALMWVLHEQLGMDKQLLLCEANPKRGTWMLEEIMKGGHFGRFAALQNTNNDISFFLKKVRRQMQMIPFAPLEVIWLQLTYWKRLFKRIPERIQYRRLSLRKIA